MSRLLLAMLRWVMRNLLNLALILALLLCGQWLHAKWNEVAAAREQLAQLQARRPDIGNQLLEAAQALERQLQVDATTDAGLGKLQHAISAGIKTREAERVRLTHEHPIAVKVPATREFGRMIVLDMELSMLEHAGPKAAALATRMGDVAGGRRQIDALKRSKFRVQTQVYENKLEQWQIRTDHPVASRVPFSYYHERMLDLAAGLPELLKAAGEAQVRIDNLALAVNLNQRAVDDARQALTAGHGSLEKAIAGIDARIEQNRRVLTESFLTSVMNQLPIALGVLVSIILAPVGIKLFFYYALAPWASRQPPICVLPRAAGQRDAGAKGNENQTVTLESSGVSLAIRLQEGEELLLHSDYVQSSPAGSKKSTRWVLNRTYPFTSLVAGMVALTRILPFRSEPIIASSSADASMEVAIIEVGDGAAIVFQPHSLVGVIQAQSRPLRITSHWRLGHLHSWLTLQLRYLVFHGPARLIVRGCRGVRLETAQSGRLVNQAATLGFSANLQYSNTRCETFVTYWRGQQGLFNDRFDGEPGVCIYEEVPSMSRKSGITGRGLEGLTDSALKVFGV